MCEQLGLRLYNEQYTTTTNTTTTTTTTTNSNTNSSNTNNAILCYICAGNIQRTVDLWSQELRASARDPSTGNLNSNLLQNYIEKVTIFTSINNNPPKNTTNNASNINLPVECSEYFTQYAMLIAAQGQFDLALSFLKGNSIGESILMDRLYHASSTATSTTSKSGGGVGGKIPVFPFERVNVNAIQGLTTTTINTAATATTAACVKPVGVAATATTGLQQGGVQRGGGFTPQQPVAQPAVATTPAAQVLAPGWAQSTDPASGRVYYFNQAAGQSQWEAPLVAAAPTPVPQPVPQPVQPQQQPNMYHRQPTVGQGINTDPAFAQPQPAFAQPYSPQSQIQQQQQQQQQPLGGYPSQQPQQQQPQYQQQQAYQPIQQQQPQQPRIGSFPSAIPGPGPTSAFGTGPSPSTFQPQPVIAAAAAAAPVPQPVPVPEPKVLLPDSEGVLLLEQVINAVAGKHTHIHSITYIITHVFNFSLYISYCFPAAASPTERRQMGMVTEALNCLQKKGREGEIAPDVLQKVYQLAVDLSNRNFAGASAVQAVCACIYFYCGYINCTLERRLSLSHYDLTYAQLDDLYLYSIFILLHTHLYIHMHLYTYVYTPIGPGQHRVGLAQGLDQGGQGNLIQTTTLRHLYHIILLCHSNIILCCCTLVACIIVLCLYMYH